MSDLLAPDRPVGRRILVHPPVVRLTHWINATAILMMVSSGWVSAMHPRSCHFVFRLGRRSAAGWGGAIAWHLAAMWLLFGNALVYCGYSLFRCHFLRSFLPVTPVCYGIIYFNI